MFRSIIAATLESHIIALKSLSCVSKSFYDVTMETYPIVLRKWYTTFSDHDLMVRERAIDISQYNGFTAGTVTFNSIISHTAIQWRVTILCHIDQYCEDAWPHLMHTAPRLLLMFKNNNIKVVMGRSHSGPYRFSHAVGGGLYDSRGFRKVIGRVYPELLHAVM